MRISIAVSLAMTLVATVAGRRRCAPDARQEQGGVRLAHGADNPGVSHRIADHRRDIGGAELVAAPVSRCEARPSSWRFPVLQGHRRIAPVDPQRRKSTSTSTCPRRGTEDRADGRQRQQRRDSGGADDRHAVGTGVDSAERAVRVVARVRRLRQRLGPSDGRRTRAGGRPRPAPPPADWTTNDEALTNFAYAQMKKTHDVAVALVAAVLRRVDPSQLLPRLVAGRPRGDDGRRSDFRRTTTACSRRCRRSLVHSSIGDPLARAKTQTGDGWIPPAKVAVIAKEVLRQCDALDGIEDGLVSNYIACNRKFDPAVTPDALAAVRCADGADTGETCLSDAQIGRPRPCTATVYSRSRSHNGWTTFSGWATGSESAMNWKTFPARPSRGRELRDAAQPHRPRAERQRARSSTSRTTRRRCSSSRRSSTRPIPICRRSAAAAAS